MFSARTSAVAHVAIVTTLPLKSRPNCETYSSSALRTAVPPCGQGFDQFILGARDFRHRIEEFQVHRSHVGDHSDFRLRDFRQRAISPACDMPISMTATSCSGSSFSSISGNPK